MQVGCTNPLPHMTDGVQWIQFETETDRAPAPPGIVYATDPRVGRATNGKRYFLKGPQIEVVVAEALGYMLGAAIGLSVPDWALCHAPGSQVVMFASEAVQLSSGIATLLQAGKVVNPELLPRSLAFDIWVANTDRNMGSLVAHAANDPRRPGAVELFAIDFEQAQILRGTDFLTVGALPDAELWPRGEIASLCRGLTHPAEACDQICRVTRATIEGIFERLGWGLTAAIPWRDSAIMQLERRAQKIDELVRRVWRA